MAAEQLRLTRETLPDVLSARQAASFLGVGKWLVYERVAAGELPGRKLGPRVLISKDALLRWLDGQDRVLPQKR